MPSTVPTGCTRRLGSRSRGNGSSFLHGHDRYLVELRDHGTYGVEAQFWQNEEFSYSQRFEARALAIQWAEEERRCLVKGRRLEARVHPSPLILNFRNSKARHPALPAGALCERHCRRRRRAQGNADENVPTAVLLTIC